MVEKLATIHQFRTIQRLFMISSNDIRRKFLDFFEDNNHKIFPSSSLVPHNDPSLMFTNSGMVQFKGVFTGKEPREVNCATTSQKCVRAGGKHNDLDNVGYTARHHTFFEMLGNFSFGNYFKEKAIYYAWELLTKELSIPKDRLYVTVYHTDEEATTYWKKIAGLSDDRIIKIKSNDNFWSMGDTGPCGPCTEIFYDHGSKIQGGLPGTAEQDGDRYVEIWNLVFMQYEQLADGSRIKLPSQSVDTGMGLERVSAVLQEVHNNYDTDLFTDIINHAEAIVGVRAKDAALTSYRIIADHLRSSCFLIADGVMPSNEGRGYVLRRIMRRAMRHAHQLGCRDPLVYKLVNSLSDKMGNAYPELLRAEKLMSEVLYLEESNFKTTLDKGLKLLHDELNKIGSTKLLSGEVAFRLYDTYGFPLDLTTDILKSKNIDVDLEGFNKSMQEQKDKAKASWSGSGETKIDQIYSDLHHAHGATEFLGYESTKTQANIIAIIAQKDTQFIVTNQTPFYGESGGQLGDRGWIILDDGTRIPVLDTKKYSKINIHIIAKEYKLHENQEITLKIDEIYRDRLRANHSASHLLHHALRITLGSHVTQKGSLVAHDRLRFDISHIKAISRQELSAIEEMVNRFIIENHPVNTILMDSDKAIESGAMALFGEKYDNEVRVVSIGDSTELCGGTHVKRSGDIGLFKIISENSISSGVRRIEAVTGVDALHYTQNMETQILNASLILKVTSNELFPKIQSLMDEKKSLEKELASLQIKELMHNSAIKQARLKDATLLKFVELTCADPKIFRDFAEIMRHKDAGINLIFNKVGSTYSLIVTTKSSPIKANDLIREISSKFGNGSGGGSAEIAQAGGITHVDELELTKLCENKL